MFNVELYENFKHLDIETICRICLSKKDDVFSISENGLIRLLMECSSVQITEEDGSYLICNYCANEINHWYTFRQQVINSQQIGKWLIRQKQLANTEFQSSECDDTNMKLNTSNICETEECGKDTNNKALSENYNNQRECYKVFECPKCTKVFKQSQALSDHLRRHYNSRNYACEICGKKFYKMFNVHEHMRIHTGERPFSCNYCSRTFTRALLLRKHIKNAHTGEKEYSCEVCSKSFVDGYQLKIHMRIHTGEKPYPCSQCNKAFAMQGQLKSHVKYKHTLEKDFVCSVCGRAFTAKHTLDEHMRTHSGEKKEPRHTCETCGKKCITTTQLKIHIRSVHTGERPFPCQICSKRFVTKTSMESHMKTHTGEKSFICCECGKGFSAKSSLKTHERIHSGERPYQCNLCGRGFIQTSTLKTHMKVHDSTL